MDPLTRSMLTARLAELERDRMLILALLQVTEEPAPPAVPVEPPAPPA